MKNVLVTCLMSLVLAGVASAQGLQRRTLGSRLQRSSAAQPAVVSSTRSATAEGQEGVGPSALQFSGTLDELLNFYSEELDKKTILKDPAAKLDVVVTFRSPPGQRLEKEEKIAAIVTVLEMNGVHLEPYGDSFIRVLPRKNVRKEGIPLYLDEKTLEADVESGIVTEGKVISFMIRFKHISEEDMERVALKVLESFKSDASGAPVVLSSSRRVLVTDTYLNIKRMLEIVSEIDFEQRSEPLPEVEIIRIQNASASDIVPVIERIVTDSQKDQEELQKKGVNTSTGSVAPQSSVLARPLLGGLRRPGQSAQPEPPAAALVVNASEAAHGIIKGRVTAIAEPKSNQIILITKSENMQLFKRIIAELDVPTDKDVRVYRLKYAEAEEVADMLNDLKNEARSNDSKKNAGGAKQGGSSANLTRNTQSAPKAPGSKTSESLESAFSGATFLYDKRINGLVVMAERPAFPTIEKVIESMDIKLSQVLIETVIIEVNLGDGIETGVDWVRTGRQHTQKQATDANGNPLYFAKQTTTRTITDEKGNIRTETSTMPLTKVVGADYSDMSSYKSDDGLIETTVATVADTTGSIFPMMNTLIKGNLINGNDGFASMMGGGAGSADGTKMLNNVINGWTDATPVGGGINYFLKSDKLNLAAVIKASKTDSRTKYVASPVIMTLDNKEAVINATKMRYLLKGFTSSGNSYSTIAVPDYEQKELGIEIKVTPKINPNGTVMLTVEEKYSQVAGSQDIKYATGNTARSSVVEDVKEATTGEGGSSALETVNVDTTSTREMSADVLLENGQTVVFGGLTETFTQESETGIPILKDIPIIGKWLFGSVSQNESRSELLVFMTPYVLDDSQAAQAEALRRKKTMSDPRPWEDHGWSLSPLADPVSKQEQMRRIKDEWRIQDEERRTKIAIEKAKVERVKKLEAMSKEERELWLKMHKEELDAEKQDELEEKMLDEKSQEELKKLAAQIRKEKLGEAEKALKAAEDESAAENERGKLDTAKKAKEKGSGIGDQGSGQEKTEK